MLQSSIISNDKLADELEKAGQAFLVGVRSIKPFRDIQKFFWWYKDQFNKDGQDENKRFLVFFMDVFIHKVIYNLAGELPDVKPLTGDVQLVFNKTIGEILCSLARFVRKNQTEEFCKCYRQMGIAYLSAVDTLNKGLKRG
jgi:hypothetical protein